MNQHSPTPWRVAIAWPEKRTYLHVLGDMVSVKSADSEQVVALCGRPSQGEAHANAALIAAAPDLLSSLKTVLSDWEELAGDCPPHLMPPLWHNAQAAIAKAEGRS